MQRDGGPGGGGPGGGGPVGSSNSFTGAAEALEILGEHAYAMSGRIQVDDSLVKHLEFTSGNYYFVGTLLFTGPMNPAAASVTGGLSSIAVLSFNGQAVLNLKTETFSEQWCESTLPIIIPPYTKVTVEVICSGDSAGFTTSVNLSGRIYRG